MSIAIHFGNFFDENTTVDQIFDIFAKNEGKLYKAIMANDFGSSDAKNASLVDAAISFFAGVHVNDSAGFQACGYNGAVSTWTQNVFNGCFGSTLQYAKHPEIDKWKQHIRDLLKKIHLNKANYTAGDVYQMIESDPLWQNSYTGSNGKFYDMEIARKNLLAFVKDPENYVKTEQSPKKATSSGTKVTQPQTGTIGSDKELPKDPTLRTLIELIRNHQYQIVLTGAPGTGKTYSAKEVAKWFHDEGTNSHMIEKVQFHPSYDYTDFVEGLRPVEEEFCNAEGNMVRQMHFRRVDGSFMRFCRYVAWQNEVGKIEASKQHETDEASVKKLPLYFFIIDEINRADLSKVFGELMFAMEGDKRGEPVSTQYCNLETYFNEEERKRDSYYRTCFDSTDDPGFFIPENVVIIGTMNDIDRSVESMDFAMRRRFVWVDVLVTEELLIRAFQSGNFGELVQTNADTLAKRIVAFNAMLHNPKGKYGLNTDYDISQGQFSGIKDLPFANVGDLMAWVWNYRVKLLLKEYLRGRVDDAENELKSLEKVWLGTASEEEDAPTETASDHAADNTAEEDA